MSSNGKNGKQKEKDDKKERRAAKTIAHAIVAIREFEILEFRKVLNLIYPDNKWSRGWGMMRMDLGGPTVKRWEGWAKNIKWLTADEKSKVADRLKANGVIPHGIPVSYLLKKPALSYALIHYWMKSEVRLDKYCREAIGKLCGKYLVYFLPNGSHVIDPRILCIDVPENSYERSEPGSADPNTRYEYKSIGYQVFLRLVSPLVLIYRIFKWIISLIFRPVGRLLNLILKRAGYVRMAAEDDEEEDNAEDKKLDDIFSVTETSVFNKAERKRSGPLIPFERFHAVTLIPVLDKRDLENKNSSEAAIERLQKDEEEARGELDAEFLIIQDEGGDQISGTFQFKGAIGRFRGRKRQDIPEMPPLKKMLPIPLEKITTTPDIDRELVDDLLNDMNMNSHQADL